MSLRVADTAVKGTVWTVGIFYILVAFEFFYMATPFALYFYGAYLPGLETFNRVPQLAWTTGFFLPHFAKTSSFLVNAAPIAGGALTMMGIAGFLVGAAQVYSRKLLRRGAATAGMYRFIRHPQYASLILAGAGMLLLWPRLPMAVFFVAMLFAYTILAEIEERQCVRKYGQAYVDYMRQTPRFLPFAAGRKERLTIRPHSRMTRVVRGVAAYLMVSALVLAAAFVVQGYSIRHLYAYYSRDATFLSLTPMDDDTLRHLADRAASDLQVHERCAAATADRGKLVNYVMPWEWTVPEVPMNDARAHHTPANYHRHRYKIIYTKAVMRGNAVFEGPGILRDTTRTEPVVEAWIDEEGRVVRVLAPPTRTFYGKAPVPIY